jgi:hypothetical protein
MAAKNARARVHKIVCDFSRRSNDVQRRAACGQKNLVARSWRLFGVMAAKKMHWPALTR